MARSDAYVATTRNGEETLLRHERMMVQKSYRTHISNLQPSSAPVERTPKLFISGSAPIRGVDKTGQADGASSARVAKSVCVCH